MKLKGILQLPPHNAFARISNLSAAALLLTIYLIGIGGCGAGKSDPIKLPDNKPIEASEKERLHDSCQAWFLRSLDSTEFHGGILVAKDGNIIFEIYKGEVIPGSGRKITDTTSVHIASVSKTFTAMAVLKLWEEKKLDIDEDVAKYIENFPFPGVTIRHLLSHRSGLPNYTSFMDATGWNKDIFLRNKDIPDILIEHKGKLPPAGTPGRNFSYCNSNFALLALIIEKVSGKTYPAYLSENFFKPLGMQHSFVRSDSTSANVLLSCDGRGKPVKDNYLDLVYGDKNVYSTPRDLLIWEKALRSGMLFSPETLQQAYSGYSNEKRGLRNYGLGWRLLIYPDSTKIIYHNGWWHGNNAVFMRIPQQNAVIIALGNRYNKSIYKARELTSLFYQSGLPDEDE